MSIDVTDDDILEYAHKLEKKISRLQAENKKLRDALIEERAKYNALSGWYLDEDGYARLSDDLSGDGEIPGRQFFQNEAESELRAEMQEVNWDE